MEVVGFVVLVVLAIPIGLLHALIRIGRLESGVEELRAELTRLRREARQATPPASADSPSPAAASSFPDPVARRSAAPRPSVRTDAPGDAAVSSAKTTGAAGPAGETREGAAAGARAPDAMDPPETTVDATDPPETTVDAIDPPETTVSEPTSDAPEPAATPSGVDMETLIGSTWLLRIGLGILAIALALFARLVAPQLTPPAKVALAYAGALALVGVGKYFEERLDRFAKPVMAGGLAFAFFVAYAAHFVPAMRAVSLPVSIGWMAASMLTVLVAAERWRSESTAILAIVLGHVSAQVSAGAADFYSLVMIGLLAVTALVLLLRHGWIQLGLLGVVASYGAHLLWILADRQPPIGQSGFWLSLAFLTSYYVIFLVADVLWWHRHADVAEVEDRGRLERNARALGPVNLILYVSVATFLYLTSGAAVESIEWFYLTLGVVQGALAWLYRTASHRDFVYYPVFGTVLWTLGLFAALDALVLNLVLASQALLLLLAARRTKLRVFHLLSQAAMGVAFVHYLVYPPPDPALGVFLGGMGIASVYLAKAYLEEGWYSFRFLAELHAVLGGVVILRESIAYLEPDLLLGGFLAVVALALASAAVWGSGATLLFTASTMAAGLPLTALMIGIDATWTASIGFTVTALLLAHVGGARVRAGHAKAVLRHARAIGALVLLAAFLSIGNVTASLTGYLLWMLVPAGLVGAQLGVDARGSADARPDSAARFMYVALAVLVIALTREAATSTLMEPVWIAFWSAALFSVFAFFRLRGLLTTGYTLLLGGYVVVLNASLVVAPGLGRTSHAALSTWWAATLLAVVPFAVGWGMDRWYAAASPVRESSVDPGVGRDGPDGSPDPSTVSDGEALFATLAPYLLGLLLVGAIAAELASLGWIYLAPAAAGLVLLAEGRRSDLPRSVLAAVLGAGAWHIHFLTVGARAPGVESALVPLAAFAVATLAVERGASGILQGDGDHEVVWPILLALVLLATVTGMAAVYFSDAVGPQWITAGWSIWGGAMMVGAFLLRSSVHRRVALAVLVVCIGRVFVVDTVGLSDTARIGAFLILGLILVSIALLYNRYSEELESWM